jgi:hypothetical protein
MHVASAGVLVQSSASGMVNFVPTVATVGDVVGA